MRWLISIGVKAIGSVRSRQPGFTRMAAFWRSLYTLFVWIAACRPREKLTRGSHMPTNVHPVDEHLPMGRLTALGLQHVLVMYAGAVAVPLIVGRALNLTPDQVAKLISPTCSAAAWSR